MLLTNARSFFFSALGLPHPVVSEVLQSFIHFHIAVAAAFRDPSD